MSDDAIAAPVRALVAERVHGYEQLEALLYLHARPDAAHTVGEVAAALKIPAEAAAGALRALAGRDLAAAPGPGAYRFAPATPQLHAAVALLERAYAEQRLAIMKLMSDNAIERLRTGATRAFVDAFLIRRRKDDR